MATKALHVVPTARPDYLGHDFQAALARWNRTRLQPGLPAADWEKDLDRDRRMLRLEGAFLDSLRAEVAEQAAAAPTDPDGFVVWFEGLKEVGPGQGDPLFPWIAEEADLEALRWFLEQEAAGEAGFDDLVAMTQVKFPVRAKLELARNYWDEMGRGNPKGMHGPLLDVLVERLALEPTIEATCWQSLALANAMTAMATRRDHAFHSVGALGAIELTAPSRSACTAAGLKRLGFTGRERHYFDLHAVLDVRHSEEWNKEVLAPLVAEDPARAVAIAQGALMRLKCGARCYEQYRAELWG
jgi:Iron-containing redox enzyme